MLNVAWELHYRLMNPTAIQGLHGALRGTGIVVFNESIVESLSLQKHGGC